MFSWTHTHWTGSTPTGQASGGLFQAAKTSCRQAPTSGPQRAVSINNPLSHSPRLQRKERKQSSEADQPLCPLQSQPTMPMTGYSNVIVPQVINKTHKAHGRHSNNRHKLQIVLRCFHSLPAAPAPTSGARHSSLHTLLMPYVMLGLLLYLFLLWCIHS